MCYRWEFWNKKSECLTAKFDIYHLSEHLMQTYTENTIEQKHFLPKPDFQEFSEIGINQFYMGF